MSTILRPLYPVRPLLRKNADQLGLFGGMEPVKATAKAKARQKLYGGTAAPVAPKPKTAPKPMAVPGKKPKEGDTRTNRAGNKEVLRSGRWRLADNPQVVAKEPPAAIVPVVEDIQEQDLVDESLPDVPMADPEPMPEDEGMEDEAEVMPEVEAEEDLSSANKIPATYEETQNSNLTWEDIPALYENGHIDQIAWILDQPFLSLPFHAASRMLSILGFKDAKKKQILNKRYREEFFKKYPDSPGPSDWHGGFDIYILRDAIESEGSLSKQKSQRAAKTQKVLKDAKEAFKANRHTGVQAYLLDLERKRKSLMDKASDMYDDAERMNRIWADARESGEIQGGQRHWVDALSARGQGPVGTRQRAHKRRLEAQKIKQEIEKIAQDPSFYENRYMHLASDVNTIDPLVQSTTPTPTTPQPEPEPMPEEVLGDEAGEGEGIVTEEDFSRAMTKEEKLALQMTSLKGVEQKSDGIYYMPHKVMTNNRREKLGLSWDSRWQGQIIEVKEWADVTGNPYDKGYAIIDRRKNLLDRYENKPEILKEWLKKYGQSFPTLTKALHPGPYLTLLGVRYVLDSDRGVLRKASMSWEEFRSEAEAMHKEANSDDDPCWKGYEAVGMKRKKGRMVPNCVPVSR